MGKTGGIQGDDPEEDRWSRVQVAFAMLKNKIATAPILRHFDPDREPVVIIYASEWAISASLVQEYEGVYMPGDLHESDAEAEGDLLWLSGHRSACLLYTSPSPRDS